MIENLDREFGPEGRPRLDDTASGGVDGALACLESFYFALNHADLEVLGTTWATDALVQLNNPVGGTLRGHDAVVDLYRKIFAGDLDVKVTFGDAVLYTLGEEAVVVAGRETGDYRGPDGSRVPLTIRTTRVVARVDGHWRQVHHHGSIDDPEALDAYRSAALGGSDG